MDSRIGSAPTKAPAGPSMESILAVRQAAKQMLRPPSRARRPSQQFPNVPVSEAVEQRFGHRLFVGPNDAEERPYIGATDDEGRRHGEGTYTWDNGDTYEGEWVEDRREGHGTMTWASGARYDGDWLNDRQHGEGEFVSARGNKYIGEWFEGKRHGEGRARYKTTNNELYTGEFQNGKKHGNGKYKTNLGDFEGQWANGCKHGWGTFSRKVRYGEQESEYDGYVRVLWNEYNDLLLMKMTFCS